jgi:hypothetical protein
MMLESGSESGEVSMEKKKGLAAAIAAVGVVILLVSALADIIGIGGNPLVFGYRQLVGAAVGGMLAVAGAVLHWWFGRGD